MTKYSRADISELAGIIADFMNDYGGDAKAAARAIIDAGYQKETGK